MRSSREPRAYVVFRKAPEGKWARLHVCEDYGEAQQVAREMRKNTGEPHIIRRLQVVYYMNLKGA